MDEDSVDVDGLLCDTFSALVTSESHPCLVNFSMHHPCRGSFLEAATRKKLLLFELLCITHRNDAQPETNAFMSPCALHVYTVSTFLTQSSRTYESHAGHACLRSNRRKHRNKCRMRRVSAQDLNSTIVNFDWPLQASMLGLLFSYACYAERPRGWADSSFVEVHMGPSSLTPRKYLLSAFLRKL